MQAGKIVPALIVLVLGILLSNCQTDTANLRNSKFLYKNWHPEAQFVGRQACQECHPDKYASLVESQMGRSWKKASLSLSDANFRDPAPVYSPEVDLFYQPFHKGEDLFVREYRIERGDTVHNRVEQIDFIVGSGQHTNSHIYDQNGYLYQIPVTWYAQDGHWDLAPGFQSLNDRFSRPIPEECMTCHNGRSPIVPGSENRYYSVAEGIGCERCHGPGSVHIGAIRAGIAVDITREIDYTIVNPGKLPPERELDLCARCHMQGVDVFRSGVQPDDFRPGKRLGEFEEVFWPRQPDSVTVFNMASHPDRLGMSQCFMASWDDDTDLDRMTCTTCHDPHVAIETKGPDYYASQCQTCHAAENVTACSNPDVVAGIIVGECASCHMPTSRTDDIPHVRITDHFIRVVEPLEPEPPETPSADDQRVIRMASLVSRNVSESDLARGYLNYFEKITNRPVMLDLAESALQRAQRTEPRDSLIALSIHLWYLQQNYEPIRRIVRLNPVALPTDAWTLFRIGEAFNDSGELDRAVEYFSSAVNRAPGHLRFMDRQALAYSRMGLYDVAISIYTQILLLNPTFEPAVNNRGFAYLASGDFQAAEEDFRYAIRLNPDAEEAIGNLASLLFNTDRMSDARPLVERLLALRPGDPQYLQLWDAVRE